MLSPSLEWVEWCSGYHSCLTHRRSSVRSRPQSISFFGSDVALLVSLGRTEMCIPVCIFVQGVPDAHRLLLRATISRLYRRCPVSCCLALDALSDSWRGHLKPTAVTLTQPPLFANLDRCAFCGVKKCKGTLTQGQVMLLLGAARILL